MSQNQTHDFPCMKNRNDYAFPHSSKSVALAQNSFETKLQLFYICFFCYHVTKPSMYCCCFFLVIFYCTPNRS